MSEPSDTFDLEQLRGAIAVVTGAANNGIGWGICQHAAAVLGMHVVAVDLQASRVEDAQARLRNLFPDLQCLGVQCDVTVPEQLDACLATIRREMPGKRIGAVFANAGVIFNHTVLKSTFDEWATTLNVNVLGVVNTIKTFVPVLREQGTPAVVSTTASIGGLVRGDGGGAAYQASKHAVVALTESLSFELARSAPHIRVHVLCPCIVASGLGQTSAINKQVESGAITASQVPAPQLATGSFAMTTENHARQVFDHIQAGNFYMITDNVRPYVDHDYPFDGLALVRERFDNLMTLKIDNRDALGDGTNGVRTAILKGPMFQASTRNKQGSGVGDS